MFFALLLIRNTEYIQIRYLCFILKILVTFARCKSVFSIELSLWSLTNHNKPAQPNEPIRARGEDMLRALRPGKPVFPVLHLIC